MNDFTYSLLSSTILFSMLATKWYIKSMCCVLDIFFFIFNSIFNFNERQREIWKFENTKHATKKNGGSSIKTFFENQFLGWKKVMMQLYNEISIYLFEMMFSGCKKKTVVVFQESKSILNTHTLELFCKKQIFVSKWITIFCSPFHHTIIIIMYSP